MFVLCLMEHNDQAVKTNDTVVTEIKTLFVVTGNL